jgi:DNA-binding transcriptional LysR family regulator
VGDDLTEALESGRLDVAIIPRRMHSPGIVWRRLFSERFVCIARAGHPGFGPRRLTVDAFCRLGHAPPLDVLGFTVALGWHERWRADPAHAWFRQTLTQVGEALRADGPGKLRDSG